MTEQAIKMYRVEVCPYDNDGTGFPKLIMRVEARNSSEAIKFIARMVEPSAKSVHDCMEVS